MELLMCFIMYIMWVVSGGYFVGNTVKYFKEQAWFMFGLNVMLAIHEIGLLIVKFIIPLA